MKAAEMRQSILQAAVQGKLVPQNIHDEPASELLKRIQKEKAQLVKEGKIKKEKPLPPITEDEIPYDLPEGWIWCRLGIVGYTQTGNTPASSDSDNFGSYIPFITPADIFCDKIDYVNRGLSEKGMKCGRVVAKGSVLMVCIGGSIGKCFFNDIDITCNQQINTLTPHLQENLPYIFRAVCSDYFFQSVILRASGTATPIINKSNWSKIPFPLPPLAEQQRIVAKVDELMLLCDELEAAEKELDKLEVNFAEYLPKSILQAAVQGKLVPQNIHDEPASELLKRIQKEKSQLVKEGKLKKEKFLPPITEDEIPYDLPDGWVWCRLGEVSNYGSAQNAESDSIADDSWILELEDIEKDTGRLNGIVYKKNRNSKSTKHVFEKGNVLYSKLRPYLNKVIVAQQDGYCTSEILPLNVGAINPDYAVWFLRSPFFVEYANRCSYGVKMPRLGTEDGRMALFPLPPLAEQHRIVAKVDELMIMCDELKAARTLSVTASTSSNVVPFPQIDEGGEEIGMVARGDVEGLPREALEDIALLFGDEGNA